MAPRRGFLVPLEGLPGIGDDGRHREALFGIVDRRLEHFRHGHRAVLLEHFEPAVYRAGHGHRVDPPDSVHLVLLELLIEGVERHAVRRPTTRIEADELLLRSQVDHDERVAAQARAHRLDDCEHRCSRDRRVDGVAACLEDFEARVRREGLTGGHHAAQAEDRRPERLVGESFVFLCSGLLETEAEKERGQQYEQGRDPT